MAGPRFYTIPSGERAVEKNCRQSASSQSNHPFDFFHRPQRLSVIRAVKTLAGVTGDFPLRVAFRRATIGPFTRESANPSLAKSEATFQSMPVRLASLGCVDKLR